LVPLPLRCPYRDSVVTKELYTCRLFVVNRFLKRFWNGLNAFSATWEQQAARDDLRVACVACTVLYFLMQPHKALLHVSIFAKMVALLPHGIPLRQAAANFRAGAGKPTLHESNSDENCEQC
jgi:hypothetical protein